MSELIPGNRPPSFRSTVLGLQTDPIVNGVWEVLLASVSLPRLDALVTEKELDLLDFAARVMTPAGASAPQVMGSDTGQTALTTGGRHDWPDHF
jgi:hypothetical protein